MFLKKMVRKLIAITKEFNTNHFMIHFRTFLLLSSIAVLIAMSSCSSSKDLQQDSSLFESDSTKQRTETKKKNGKLPSLQEQLVSLQNQTESLESKVNTIAKDTEVMKKDIEEIKNILSQFQIKNGVVEVPTPQKGLQGEKENTADGTEAQLLDTAKASAKKSRIIQSDETVENTKSKKVTSEKKEQQKKKSTIVSDEKTTDSNIKETKSVSPSLTSSGKDPYALLGQKKYTEAIQEFQRLANSTKNPVLLSQYHYWLGESYFRSGNSSKAIQHFQKVSPVYGGTKLDDAQYMIGMAQQKIGNKTEAKKSMERLIEMYPKSSYVPQARKMLQIL